MFSLINFDILISRFSGHGAGERCRLQNVLLVSVKFFPSSARAGLVEEIRHLYVVVILWSVPCARSKKS